MTFYACSIMLTELRMLAQVVHVTHYSGFSRQQKRWHLFTFIGLISDIFYNSAIEFSHFRLIL